jgi:hypothetical protein
MGLVVKLHQDLAAFTDNHCTEGTVAPVASSMGQADGLAQVKRIGLRQDRFFF